MTKVAELTMQLKELLATGAFPPGSRFPSEYEIQERFNVSRFTANKAMTLLEKDGLLERGKRGSGTFVKRTVHFPKGWIAVIDNFNHQYNMMMLAGATEEAFANGYMLSIFRPEANGISKLLNLLNNSDCIGILCMAYQLDLFHENFSKTVIYLDGGVEFPNGRQAHSVMCDNYGAACDLMNKIIAAGKKEIVTLGIEKSLNRKLRMQGFCDTMLTCGIKDANQRKFVMHHGSKHEVKIALQKILQKFPDVDFIATDSDDIVFSIMKVWGNERSNWQNKTNVSGFGNVHGIADLHNIPSVDQHPWHIGSEGVKTLLEITGNNSTEDIVNIQVPAEIVNAQFI